MSPERSQYRPSFDDVAIHAKEITLRDGHHVPILIIDGSKNLVVNQIQEMPETHEGRMELLRLIGKAAATSGRVGRLEQVFLISEGWMSAAREGKLPEMRPSQDPDRKEVLIISGLRIEGPRKSLKLFEIVRNQSKQVVDLPELSPPHRKEETVEIPLLDAFAQGFELAVQTLFN